MPRGLIAKNIQFSIGRYSFFILDATIQLVSILVYHFHVINDTIFNGKDLSNGQDLLNYRTCNTNIFQNYV